MKWDDIHSLLFVPAHKKRLEKVRTLHADAYIIDLEDAIKDSEKDRSREEVREFLLAGVEANILLRINLNELDKEIAFFEALSSINCIVIPKAESADQIDIIHRSFPEKDILALIETPTGMINLREILSTGMVSAIGFGAEDYCARTGTEKKKEYLIPLQSRLVMYGNALNVPVYDMVNAEYKDTEKYCDYVRTAKAMGFSGKMAIHPDQIDVINREFRRYDAETLKSIVRKYEAGTDGFVIIDGEIYEKPHIDQINKLLGNQNY